MYKDGVEDRIVIDRGIEQSQLCGRRTLPFELAAALDQAPAWFF